MVSLSFVATIAELGAVLRLHQQQCFVFEPWCVLSRRVCGGLPEAFELSIHLDDAVVQGVRVEGILDVALAHDAQVPNHLFNTIQQHVMRQKIPFKKQGSNVQFSETYDISGCTLSYTFATHSTSRRSSLTLRNSHNMT